MLNAFCFPDCSEFRNGGIAFTFTDCASLGYYWSPTDGVCLDSPDTPEDCNDFGWIWSFTNNTCHALFGAGGDFGCPNPPPIYYCGQVMPEMSGECQSYYMTTGTCFSPVLIDINGDGFSLTDASRGVRFDLDGNPGGE